ncbi:MAG: glycosyltransferase family 2 protein [Trueperaceae bacterium]
MAASLGIAVIHYRTPNLAFDCLARLAQAAPGAEVVVVDTAPERDFADQLAARHPDVRFVATANHSYAHSVNAGLAALSAQHLAFMNADVLVEPDTFTALRAALDESTGEAVVAPLALTAAGSPQPMGPGYQLHYRRLRRLRERSAASDSAVPAPPSIEVPWLAGYLQLVHRALWDRVGGYDESFRFFNEDIDFCLRARALGYTCRLVDTPVVHLGGSSTPAHPAFHAEGRRGGMVITQRHHGAAYQGLHLAYLWAEALIGRRLARTTDRRRAHALVLEMLRSGDWSRSPFGATLDERRS